MIFIYISSNVTIAVLFSIAILLKRQKKRELLTKVSQYSYFVWSLNNKLGDWGLGLDFSQVRNPRGVGGWGRSLTPHTPSRCEPLQLRLQIERQLIGFYREDTGEKLLISEELVEALKQERLAREQAQEQVRQAELQVERLKEHLRRREAACR
ncbi:MAG: hypothetical protein V7L22_12400 [Nostoc sp.]|uniref:hypothetical protein n=1 Tax=Nostoc sp. TaxID=1180 RepID=UPI002FF7596E